MIDPKDVTIIVPHLGQSREVSDLKQMEFAMDQCLISLHETVPQARIIVAKNGGQACGHAYGVELNIRSQGQNKAVNAAVAMTNTPWIFVTNDDMIYAPRWFEKLVAPMTEKTMCISPMLVEPRAGAPTFIVEFCGGAGGDFDKKKWLEFANKHNAMNMDFNKITPGGLCRTGFNLPFLISRELWNTIDGYDNEYDPWGSNGDSDLEYKIKLAGVQPYQNTNSIVYHFSNTSGTFAPENHSYWQKNWDYFIQKWGFPRTDDGIWEASFTIPTKEEGRIFTPEWEGKYVS